MNIGVLKTRATECWNEWYENINIHEEHFASLYGGIDEKRYVEGFEYGWNLAREIVKGDTGEGIESVMLYVVARDKDVICSLARRDGYCYDRGAYEGFKQSGHDADREEQEKIDAEVAEWEAEQNKPLTELEIVLSEFEDEFHDIITGDEQND
jgi:hypothetical protein